MPTLKNPKHERFAQEIAKGTVSTGEAYALAGFKPSRGNASTLKRQHHILERVSELLNRREQIAEKALERAIERTGIDRAWVMGRLVEIAERCMQHRVFTDPQGRPIKTETPDGEVAIMAHFSAGPATRALELLGKEIGMFINRNETKIVDRFATMTEAQLRAFLLEGDVEVRGIGEDEPPPRPNGSTRH